MLPRISIEGSPRQRGRQYGEATRPRIDAGVELYSAWFRDFGGIEWSRATDLAAPYLAFLRAHCPALAEEMLGIAEGCERGVEEIVALNARTEIAYSVQRVTPAECTSLGIRPEASSDGHLYLAENWDWLRPALDNAVLLHVTMPDGLQLLTITEAGMLAKFGVNSAGVALCNNLLATDTNQTGALFHSLSREVLQSTTLLEAMWAVTGTTRAGSGNYLIASRADEDLIDLEWAPGDFNVLSPNRGVIGHTNHFLEPLRGQQDRTKFLASVSPGTYLRQRRVDELLSGVVDENGKIGADDIRSILRDHRYAPEGICRHIGTTATRPILGQTNLSVIFDLTAETIEYALGPPCEAEYVTEPLPWALPQRTWSTPDTAPVG